MATFNKIAVIKTAWCDEYQGELAQGDHANIEENEESHESYNFKPGPDGYFYGYTPPIGEHWAAPSPKDRDGWLVFAVAKKPKASGIYLVGWYENAEFMGEYIPRPEYEETPPTLELDVQGGQYSYTLRAPQAQMIPASQRTFSFKGVRTKRAPVFYLRGNGEEGEWREELAKDLLQVRDSWIKEGALRNASKEGKGGICADSERRKEVEDAAVEAVINHLGDKYECVDRQKDNCGFDLLFVHKKSRKERHVEVKGTQNLVGHFFLSRNEDDHGRADDVWELALVTDALDKPKVEMMSYSEAREQFERQVVCWHFQRKK